MAAIPYLAIAQALGSAGAGISGGISAYKRNKKIPAVQDLPPYSGRVVPSPQRLRSVEDLTDEILMRRAQGMDVGFDPARLSGLKSIYDIGAKQQEEEAVQGYNDQLSGIGQSRNLGARQALIGKYRTEAGRERNKYFQGLDVEDLTRANEERDVNTGRLQEQSLRKFAQENAGANFDYRQWRADIEDLISERGQELENFGLYKDPIGTAIETGLSTYGATQGANQNQALIAALNRYGQTPSSQPAYQPVSQPFVSNQSYSGYGKPLSSRYDVPKRYNL